MIDPQIILGWACLKKDIQDAVNILLAHEHAPAIAWIVPTALGCQGVFKRAHILRAQFSHSKQWFSLFMGALSYAITVSITHRQEKFDEQMPHWFNSSYQLYHSMPTNWLWRTGFLS